MINESLKAISLWKESLFRMNENKFLNIVRLYIGVIKTPYNKERLVTDLVSFLYKEEHKNKIVSLLSDKDVLLLSAILFLENSTTEKLQAFFNGEFTTFYLYDYVDNLEERLLIYRSFDERTKKEYLDINPLLFESLQQHLALSSLFPVALCKKEVQNKETKILLNPALFASWYAFIAQNPDACRADGSFKKKTINILETVYHGVPVDFLEALNTAFVHLSLFIHDGTNLCVSENKWKAFCQLKREEQALYICIASFRRFNREQLTKYALFCKTLLQNIPKEGFTKELLLRLSFIIKNKQNDFQSSQKASFFSNVLNKAKLSSGDEDIFTDSALIDKMVYLRLLTVKGQDKNGKDVLCASSLFTEKNEETEVQKDAEKKDYPHISINAGFSVTFLTTTTLDTLLELVCCMNITSFDTVCHFEITRASCMRSFDKGETEKTLLEKLEKASKKSLSQNLIFSINEWYETYNSASLYYGYVLQVSKEKIVQIENSMILSPRIKKVLAPGIFVFDFESREEMVEAFEKSSLDFIGLPKMSIKETEAFPFSSLKSKNKLIIEHEIPKAVIESTYEEHIKKMKSELDLLTLPKEQKEALCERIERKIILSPKQLVGETVRIEKTEASGIDFMGKIQVIEQAILSSNMIEITSAQNVYVGRPLKIEKKDGDASVTVGLPDSKTIILLIGQARNVKRFRQPLY